MKSQFFKLCSLVLTIALLMNLLPASAIAQTLQENNAASSETGEAAETSAEDVRILSENTDKRTAFTKDYKLSNGFNMSVVYPEVVHFEENGQWKEIDNTLKASGTGTNAVYTNTTGGWNAVFPQQLTKSSRVSVVKAGYTVSFGMAGELRSNAELMSENGQASRAASAGEELSVTQMQTATAQIAQRASAEELAEMEHPEIVREKLHSRLTYEDVYSNIDIVYDLNGYQLKESVVINSYDSKVRGYQYVLETGSLTPVLNEDGSIDLFAPGTEEPIMEMPAPYMVDSSGAVSYDVDISLVPQDGNYMLTYRMPTAWLEDSARVWPVVLDPIVTALSHRNNILDQFVAEYYSESYIGGALFCGYYPDFGKMRSYIQYENLPSLTSADVVVYAELSLKYRGGNSTTTTIEAHKVNADWDSQTITWANQPQYNNTVEDFAIVNSSTDRYEWVITELVRDWYTSANTGVMLKAPDSVEAGPTNNWKKFYSIDFDRYDSTISPYLNIVYRNTNGLESYWDYTATSAGRAGTGYVNNYSGNLTWVRSDLGFGGNRMPVAISHVYNANDAQSNSFGLGYGWRTNYHQTVSSVTLVDEGNNILTTNANYVWTDGDGTKHYFVSEGGEYVDEDGLELKLAVTSAGYTITDKDGNTSNFDSKGRLVTMINNQTTKSSITITYTDATGLKISSIADGAGRDYLFTYTNGLLSEITYTGTGSTEITSVTYFYENSLLQKITDKDTKTSSFAYGSNGLLGSVTDADGYCVQYTYSTTLPARVVGIRELDGTTVGGNLNIEYDHNQTTLTDHNNNKQILQFNDWGNVVSVQDNEGHAQFAQYAANWHGETGKTSNQLTLSSKMQNTVVSYFKDKSFENGTTWSALSSAVTCSNSTTTAYYGSKSLKMTRATAGAATGIRYMGGYIESGVTISFSAWVKTDSTASAWLQITSATGETAQSEVLPSGSDWTRLEVALTPSTNARVYPELIMETAGTVYMDCVQFEKAASASRYNLIDNGDFRYDLYDWARGTGLTTADNCAQTNQSASAKMSTAAFPITGNPTGQKYLYQTVKVSGSAGDCYVLGGWAKGDSVPLGEVSGVNREFGLKLIFNNTDSSKTTRYVSFNCDLPSSGNWQYAATAAVAEKPYSSITVQLVYNYNANTVYFDGIQLFKEQFGSSYTYDSNGNVTKVEDLQKQETEYKYENNKLTEIIQNGKAKMTYVYDAYHNVTKATTGEGLVYEFTYDDFGNNLTVSIGDGDMKITSSAEYSTDGNLLVSTTDALDKTTTYGYNEDTNVLEWVKYPNDTNATRTEYSYDSMYRLASSSVDLAPNATLSVSYTYTDDLLTKIQTTSTTYNFSYGDFSQRTGVSVGTQALASYAYTNDKNRYLQRLTYGNGDYVQYTYDSHGRVVGETYEDGSTVSYAYDNSGALATVTDSETGITTKYYYDLTERMMKYVESGDGYSHSVGYEYDTLNNLTHLVETINGVKHTSTYTYDEDNRVTRIDGSTIDFSYAYDSYGRLEYSGFGANSTNEISREYFYATAETGTQTSQISRLDIDTPYFIITNAFEYDDNGNLTLVDFGTKSMSYAYDSANQLIREKNSFADRTWVWTYDDAGNILSRTEYAYTTGELGEPIDTVLYGYSDGSWGDLLTSYDGQTITYDNIGNPLFDGTWNYTWEQGRQLASMSNGTTTWDYTYDANGMRTSRSNGTATYRYVYNGGQLSQMTVGGNTLTFTYDVNGTPAAVTYNGTVYYYITTLQGDVLMILNADGDIVVDYTYDAWGRLISSSGTMASTLGTINPLRYRGYVYDNETDLYYLQSRYYDPEIGRFINADAFTSTGQGILGNNMFTYCGNNPIMRIDEAGHAWKWWDDFWNDVKDWLEEKKEEAESKPNITVSYGYTGSVIFGGGGSASIGLTSDTKGNVGIAITTNGGGGFPSVGVGNYVSINNAPTIDAQKGLGTAVGASGGPGLAGGGEYNMIIDRTTGKVYHGGTVAVTVGFYPTIVEVHGEIGHTWVNGINIYDKAIQVIDFLLK